MELKRGLRSPRVHIPRNLQVKFLAYASSMQENCLRLMGKKMLVSLALEGKYRRFSRRNVS